MLERTQGRRIRIILVSSIVFALALVSLILAFLNDRYFPDGEVGLVLAVALLATALASGSVAWLFLYRTFVDGGFRALRNPPVIVSVILLLPSLPALLEVCVVLGLLWLAFDV